MACRSASSRAPTTPLIAWYDLTSLTLYVCPADCWIFRVVFCVAYLYRSHHNSKLEGMRSAEGIKSSTVAKAHVKLALLTDSLLRLQEARKRLVSPQLVETVMSNVFEGMQRLSPAARDRFPRLLELVAQFPDTQARFTRMAKAVPSWMFIRWISQMMAVLDKPEAGAVVPILLEIAKSYPQALYYPFRIRYVT